MLLYFVLVLFAEMCFGSGTQCEPLTGEGEDSNSEEWEAPEMRTYAPIELPDVPRGDSDYTGKGHGVDPISGDDVTYEKPDKSEDFYIKNVHWIDNPYGGMCRCPSGEVYYVGAGKVQGGSCGDLYCDGGEQGLCIMEEGEWSYSMVVCGKGKEKIENAESFNNIGKLFQGYNIIEGNPLPFQPVTIDQGFKNEIFDIARDYNHYTPDQRFRVPDNVQAESCANSCSFAMSATVLESQEHYKDQLSSAVSWDTSVSASAFGVGFGAAFSGSDEYATISEGFGSDSSQYIMSSATCCSYKFEHDNGADHSNLDKKFKSDVEMLPLHYDEDAYDRFVDKYGTHYVKSVTMGSKYVQIDKLSTGTMSSLNADHNSFTTAAEIGACSSALGFSASAGVQTDKEEDRELQRAYQEQKETDYTVTLGALPPKSASSGYSWAEQSVTDPQPIKVELGYITYILSPDFKSKYMISSDQLATKRHNLEKFLNGYCAMKKNSGEIHQDASCVDESIGYNFPEWALWLTHDRYRGRKHSPWLCPGYKSGNKLESIEAIYQADWGIVNIKLKCLDGSHRTFKTDIVDDKSSKSIRVVDEYSSIVGIKAKFDSNRGLTDLQGRIESVKGATKEQPAFKTPWITGDPSPEATAMLECSDGTSMVGLAMYERDGSGVTDIQIHCYATGDTQCTSGEGEFCHCNGQVRLGRKGRSTGWKAVRSSIMCSSEIIGDVEISNPVCFCRNVPDDTEGFENPTTNMRCENIHDGQRYDPIDYGVNGRTVTQDAHDCARRCELTPDCIGSSWWSDGGCHLSTYGARLVADSWATSSECSDACKSAQEDSKCCGADGYCWAGGQYGTYWCHLNDANCATCGGQYMDGNPVGCDVNDVSIGEYYTTEVDEREFVLEGCRSLLRDQCCHYVESFEEYNGSPCVPARDQFSSGVHCDSASWATLEDPSQIGSCRKVTRAKKPNANVVESADWVGEWGGTCTCPDGTQYSVGDVLWDCGALACYGGQMGQCHKMSGPWSKKKVKCDNNHINSHYDRSGKKVCWKDNCKYTKNNPVKPKHSQWLKIKHASDRGCCSGGGSACDWCAPFASEEGNDGKGNLYTWNVATVGTWGGTCTCPDGGEYFVGDNWDGCGSLACFGGTSSGCNRWVDEKWAGRSVICAGPEAPARIQIPAPVVATNFALVDGGPGSDKRLEPIWNPINPNDKLGEVQCCREGKCTRRKPWNSSKNRDCMSGNRDGTKFTLQEAKDMCTSLGPGWTLCTLQEVENKKCNKKGCNHDSEYVWVLEKPEQVAEESVADEEMLAEETVADEEKPKVSLAEDVVIDEGPSTAIVMLGVIGACAIMCQILQRARKCAHSEEWTPIIEKI